MNSAFSCGAAEPAANPNAARAALEAWVDADLARSGLTREDMEVVPFLNETYRDQQVSGYSIPFRYHDGVAMRDSKNHEFYRMRFRPPLPVSADGSRMKYGVPF